MKKKTAHCSNCCTCPRGAHRNRVDCPGAQALKPGRLGHYASGCMARCRICGVDRHPNIRCPNILATKRGARRTVSSTHKSDGRSCRGRSAPLLQSQVDTWRGLRARTGRVLRIGLCHFGRVSLPDMERALRIVEQPSLKVAQAVNGRTPSPEEGEILWHFDRERKGAGWS